MINTLPKFCGQQALWVFVASSTIFGNCIVKAEEILNWPSWRGPQSAGTAVPGLTPIAYDFQHLSWQSELPGKGSSTPVVWKKQIFLTTPSDGNDSVLCLDAHGKEIWKTTFGAEDPGKHANGSGSNSSPVTDGEGLFVYFKSGTFAALNLDGSVRWKRDIVAEYGKEQMFWDHGSSPVLTENHVVLVRMHSGDSWLAAFNKSDGELAWKTDRTYQTPVENDQCYTTPLVIEYQGQQAVLIWGAEHITIHSAKDGKLIWWCGGFNPEGNRLWPAIASPVLVGDMVVVAFGRNDRGNPLLYGVQLSGSGDVSKSNPVWKRTDVGTFVPTPIVNGEQLINLGDQGEVEALNVKSGQTIWKERLPKHRNKFYASPLLVGNQLIATREDGTVFVGEIGENQFTLKSENDMGESIIGSPVPFGNGILLRGEKHLFYVAGQASSLK